MTDPSEGLLKEAREAWEREGEPEEADWIFRLMADFAAQKMEQAREGRTWEIALELRTKIAAIQARLDTPEGTTQYRMQLLAQVEILEFAADELKRTYLKK
jgi:hypothetical protein